MSKQAKTLTTDELNKLLKYIATRKHNLRDRALVMTSFLSGMRVGEMASLRIKEQFESLFTNEIVVIINLVRFFFIVYIYFSDIYRLFNVDYI